MKNEFLATLQQEAPAITEAPAETEKTEKDTPAAPPAENKPDSESASPAEQVEQTTVGEPVKESVEEAVFEAFHKHPRWLEREQEFNELKEQNQELQKFRTRAESVIDKLEPKEDVEVKRLFTQLYGENDEAWNVYDTLSKAQRETLRKEIKEELRREKELEEKTTKEHEEWIGKEYSRVGQKYGVDFGTRGTPTPIANELSNVLLKYRPIDQKGNWDVEKGYEILQLTKTKNPQAPKPAVQAKKEIADMTMKKSAGEESKKDYFTSEDFRGRAITDFIPRE